MLKSILSSIALAVTILYGSIIAPDLHTKYLRWEVGESVVQVLHPTKFGGGTGFAVKAASGKEYIMTNRHVCEVAENGKVRIQAGNAKPVIRKVVYKDNYHDLCLIQGVQGLAPLSIGSDQEIGETLFVVGHPGLRQLTISSGEYIGRNFIELIFEVDRIEDCPGKIYPAPFFYTLMTGKDFICTQEYEALETAAVIYGGNSGSPVVNRFGNLIGVAFAGNTQQEHNNFVIPLIYVKNVLARF
jgi:S1-C subfamily serine protease